MTKIHYYNDLHFSRWFIQQAEAIDKIIGKHPEDILVCAGDVHENAYPVAEWLAMMAVNFKHVVYTPGNHEYYNFFDTEEDGESHWMQYVDYMREMLKDRFGVDNVTILTPEKVYMVEGIPFIGGTMFTDFGGDPIAEMQANGALEDFNREGLTTAKWIEWHKECAWQLLATLDNFMYRENPDQKAVVVTHFPPTTLCSNEHYRTKKMAKAFYMPKIETHLSRYCDAVAAWFYGHTHYDIQGQFICGIPFYSNHPDENGIIKHRTVEPVLK